MSATIHVGHASADDRAFTVYDSDRPSGRTGTPKLEQHFRNMLADLVIKNEPDTLYRMGYDHAYAMCRVCDRRFECIVSLMWQDDGGAWLVMPQETWVSLPCPNCEQPTVMICKEHWPEAGE